MCVAIVRLVLPPRLFEEGEGSVLIFIYFVDLSCLSLHHCLARVCFGEAACIVGKLLSCCCCCFFEGTFSTLVITRNWIGLGWLHSMTGLESLVFWGGGKGRAWIEIEHLRGHPISFTFKAQGG
jgi:hypothetical protein